MTESYSKVLIIGGGFAGIASAIRLLDRHEGTDFHIYESTERFGGTWWVNRYPGCAVDVPAFFYSISTDPNIKWSKFFPPRDEILEYIDEIVEKRGLKKYATFNSTVTSLDWDTENEEWIAVIREGNGNSITHRSKIVLSGRGGLVNPIYPSIPGLELEVENRSFKGIYAHSARWDPDISLKDKDVIVIGNGCSAIQIIPAIVDEAKSVSQFMRSKHWILPQPSLADPEKAKWFILNIIGVKLARFLLFSYTEATYIMFSDTGILANLIRNHFTREAKDFIHKTAPIKYHQLLTPDFKMGCKRRIFDAGYLKSLNNDKVLLTDDPIISVSEHHVHTKSGKTYHADVIIAATGFDLTGANTNIPIYGIDKKENMAEYWERTGISAYNVSQVPRYPNFFFLNGPNSGTAHSSVLVQIENTLTYIENVGGYVINGSASSVDARPEAYEEWKSQLKERGSKEVHMKGGCTTWYVRNGINIAIYPWSQWVYWWRAVFPKYSDQNYHWIGKNQINAERERSFLVGSLLAVTTLAIVYKLIK